MRDLRYRGLLWVCVSAMCLCLGAGCEDNSARETYNQSSSSSALSIDPSAVELSVSDTYVVFTASGGTGPYSWSVSDELMGSVNETAASTATYAREDSAVGGNVVYVKDQSGWMASAVVVQSDEPSVASTNAPAGTL